MGAKTGLEKVLSENADVSMTKNGKKTTNSFEGMGLINNSNSCYVNSDVNGILNIPSFFEVVQSNNQNLVVQTLRGLVDEKYYFLVTEPKLLCRQVLMKIRNCDAVH